MATNQVYRHYSIICRAVATALIIMMSLLVQLSSADANHADVASAVLAYKAPIAAPAGKSANCGIQGKLKKCSLPGYDCCSQWGFCGVGKKYCGYKCQKYYGDCYAPRPVIPH
ncbi:unnamed protein product [Linum trigynum]|uniref:Chitin-binding type-1 domain-containing protein n=1 Tax=Linum trigynum TaxID=586398 RepID=A0AAV2CIR0_9ROSI